MLRKAPFYLAALFGLLAGTTGTHAQTITGTVLHGNGPAAAGKEVSVYSYDFVTGLDITGSAYTDASGNYTVTMSDTPTVGFTIFVSVEACGQYYDEYASFAENEFTQNVDFTICDSVTPPPPPPPPPPYPNVTGRAELMNAAGDSIGPVQAMTIYVIDKTFDAAIGADVLTLVDTIQAHGINDYLQFEKYVAALPAPGHLLLKGALDPSDPNYATGLPGYLAFGTPSPWGPTTIPALNWSDASIINEPYNWEYNIIGILEGINPGGPGFIGGSVLMGANKGTGVGDPLGNRLVLLTKADGTPVTYQESDANGVFAFGNLAYGTYHIFGDAWGKENPHLEVTISGATPSVSNIRFDENSTSFTGSLITTGVANPGQAQLAAIRVSPIPVGDELNIEGLMAVEGAKTITLTGMGGQIIYKADLKAGADISIPVSSLASGIYLLDVATTQGTLRIKVTK